MPEFSKKSLNKLKGVDERLCNVLHEAIKYFDFAVIDGIRTKEQQANLFKNGATKTLDSKHLTGHAVDIAPWPIDWDDRERFVYLAGFIMGIASIKGVSLKWGGDWDGDTISKNTKFFDAGHFEVRG